MGHEFVGLVESCDSDPSWLGKTVCGEINFACQDCNICERKDDMSRNHCPNRTVFGIIFQDGCFADYTVMPVANLIEVSARDILGPRCLRRAAGCCVQVEHNGTSQGLPLAPSPTCITHPGVSQCIRRPCIMTMTRA